MDMDDYQCRARETATYHTGDALKDLDYAALALAGEAGELAQEVAKAIRDDEGEVTVARYDRLVMEAGDVLWQLSALVDVLHALSPDEPDTLDLSDVARANLAKLARRATLDTIRGSGEDR